MLDNNTAYTYINKMGGTHSEICNSITREIWLWVEKGTMAVSSMYSRGKDIADINPAPLNTILSGVHVPQYLLKFIEILFIPKIDLFASRLNYQIENFVL